MTRLLRVLGCLFLLLLVALALSLALALQRSPEIHAPAPAGVDQIRAVKTLLARNDPRQSAPGIRVLRLSDVELTLLSNEWLRLRGEGALHLELLEGRARLRASRPLPWGFWLNVDAALVQRPLGLPALDHIRFGRLPLPAAWVERWLLKPALAQPAAAELRTLGELVHAVRFGPGLLQLAYDWHPAHLQRLVAGYWPDDARQRLRFYQERLAQASRAHPVGSAVPMLPLMQALFREAARRSDQGADAAAENRAALLTLALYSVGQHWSRWLPDAQTWPRAQPLRLQIGGRDDFAQHFLVSAALAIEAGGPMADAIGVYKELSDAQDGSGFSFNDIAADLSGARVGLMSQQQARRLQALLAGEVREADFMPEVADLPEFLHKKDFLARYGGLEGAPYLAMMKEIEARVAALPWHR